MNLKDIIEDLQLGKVYTDKDRPPFKVESKKEPVSENKMEMKKIYQLLIKYGNSAKDAAQMLKKNYKYVAKTYRNSSPRDKAMALSGLSALGEGKSVNVLGVKKINEGKFRVTFDIEDAKLGRYTTDVEAKDKKDAEKKVAAKFVGGTKLITKGKTKKLKESEMIKLKDLLMEYSPHASEQFATDSKDGASKGLESKFKYFKKVSKEQSKHPKNSWWKSKAGVLRVDKKDSKYQVSKPDVPGKKIDYEQIKTIHYSYQVGDAIVPGNEAYAKYQLKDFLKDAKKAFSGYKMEKTSIRSHFKLKKGGNIYNLYFTPAMSGTFVSVESRV